MSLLNRYRLGRKGRLFAKGKTRCARCRARFRLKHLAPLSLARCPKCDHPNFVPLRIDEFWLYEPLGGGGGASVYKAFHQKTRAVRALKILRRKEQENHVLIEALQQEASILKQIGEHPSIVRLISSGVADDEHYCALEYIDGERLDNRISRLGHIPEPDVINMALDLLSAEKHIYERGFLYRDLKPENVIIRPDGRHILIDFGFCIPAEEARTWADSEFVQGSPHYLPPERLWRSGEGPFSEIYSLGMVMYHALTGRTFFKSTEEIEKLAVRHATALRLSVQPSSMLHCSPSISHLVDMMIRKEPNERLQSFEDVERAIRKCVQH